MESFRITLTPRSAFGSRPLGDMLFGQLCWAVRNRFGEDRLIDLLTGYTEDRPWAVVSDALPAGYLPRPSLPGHWFTEVAEQDRKLLKKRVWFPLEKVATAPVEAWLNHCQAAADLPGSTPQAHPQPHNTINRATGTTGEGQFAPYAMNQHWFGAKSEQTPAAKESAVPIEVYVLLDEARLRRDELIQVFEDMGAFGFGRDASIGLGKFSVVSVDAFELPRQAQADAYITLAPSAPQGLGFDAARSFYQTFTRFGRHGDIGVHIGKPFKTPVLLAQTGAIFSPPPGGASVNFIGQGLGGDGSLSKAIEGTVHQGYAPVVGIRLPQREAA